MTIVSLLKTSDVAALKCIYFQLAKSIKEISWYGLDCKSENYINDLELAFIYLEAINSGCELPHTFECEIKTFVATKSSYCVFSDDRCQSKYTVELAPDLFIITENDNFLITENSNFITT